MQNQILGKLGEDIATKYLEKHGYQVIDRNFKGQYGELDVICVKNNTLIFVEVKTRIGDRYGIPEEGVTPRKLREVIQTSQYYVYLHPELPESQQIDVIGIKLDDSGKVTYFNHLENVTS